MGGGLEGWKGIDTDKKSGRRRWRIVIEGFWRKLVGFGFNWLDGVWLSSMAVQVIEA